jgi:hypothetical protein
LAIRKFKGKEGLLKNVVWLEICVRLKREKKYNVYMEKRGKRTRDARGLLQSRPPTTPRSFCRVLLLLRGSHLFVSLLLSY